MRWGRELDRLIHRGELRRQRLESELAALDHQQRALNAERGALAQQQQGLQQLLLLERPQGVLDRAGLFMHQRRQAVLKRKIQQLGLHYNKLGQQLNTLEEQRRAARIQQHYWQRKLDKYRWWRKRQRRAYRLVQLCREDAETEEMMIWKNSTR